MNASFQPMARIPRSCSSIFAFMLERTKTHGKPEAYQSDLYHDAMSLHDMSNHDVTGDKLVSPFVWILRECGTSFLSLNDSQKYLLFDPETRGNLNLERIERGYSDWVEILYFKPDEEDATKVNVRVLVVN